MVFFGRHRVPLLVLLLLGTAGCSFLVLDEVDLPGSLVPLERCVAHNSGSADIHLQVTALDGSPLDGVELTAVVLPANEHLSLPTGVTASSLLTFKGAKVSGLATFRVVASTPGAEGTLFVSAVDAAEVRAAVRVVPTGDDCPP